MDYQEMLKKITDKSGLSNTEIVEKCKELGEPITTNFLSVIRNKKGRYASDKISRIIAKVCGEKNEDVLVMQGYIDRAPTKIITILEEIYTGSKKTAYMFLENAKETGELNEVEYETAKANYEKEFERLTLADFISEYIKEDDVGIVSAIDEVIKKSKEKTWLLIPTDKATVLTSKQMEELGIE